MPVQFRNPILFVRDMEASKAFYHGLLGIGIKEDFDTLCCSKEIWGCTARTCFMSIYRSPILARRWGGIISTSTLPPTICRSCRSA